MYHLTSWEPALESVWPVIPLFRHLKKCAYLLLMDTSTLECKIQAILIWNSAKLLPMLAQTNEIPSDVRRTNLIPTCQCIWTEILFQKDAQSLFHFTVFFFIYSCQRFWSIWFPWCCQHKIPENIIQCNFWTCKIRREFW